MIGVDEVLVEEDEKKVRPFSTWFAIRESPWCKCRFLCVFVLDCGCLIGVDRVPVGEDEGRGSLVEYDL